MMSLKKFFPIDSFRRLRKINFRKILDKDGFYIIMFLCVCIVGTSAVWVAKTNIDRLTLDDGNKMEINLEESDLADLGEGEINSQIDDIIIVDSEDSLYDDIPADSDSVVSQDEEIPEEHKGPIGKVLVEDLREPQIIVSNPPTVITEPVLVDEVLPASAPAPEKVAMIWPVDGEITMGYAVETLVYSRTLEHYTTHHGIDIIAEKNTPVRAALDGEVIEVLTDSRLGITITLAHEGNLMTRYSNLLTDAMVKIGDFVTQGQIISGVGDTAIFESADDPHLHFEVLKDGVNVNPLDYLP